MSGLLADLYSAGDRMKRKLGGLLSDPMGTISLGSQRMAEDTNALARLASEAGYMPNTVNRADQSVLVSERQKALARALLADKATEMGANMVGATVWHGSPHKFDKFDSSKIGTGEGAQAYGHGLYLAENPAVATEYRRTLSAGVPDVYVNGRRVAGTPFNSAANQLAISKDAITRDDLAAHFSQRIQELSNSSDPLAKAGLVEAKKALATLGKAKDVAVKYDGTAGSLYKVDLPDNAIARMLDWDKPLSQQAPEVQDALNKLPPEVKAHLGIGKYNDLKGGIDIVKPLGGLVGDAKVPPMLRQVGIPGIRYLDGGSRGAGQGTSNYVVFDDSLLKILERNGVPVK